MYGSYVFFTNRNVYFCVVVFSNYTVIFMFTIKTHFYRFILKRCHVFIEHCVKYVYYLKVRSQV